MKGDILTGLIPPVDGFVITGDITDNALATEDSYAKSWLTAAAKGKPSMWVMGNHDVRDAAGTRANWEKRYGRAANTVTDIPGPDGGIRLVGFGADVNTWAKTGDDSPWTIPDSTWSWIDDQCSSATTPVVLCCHYPPWELGYSLINSIQPVSRLDDLVSKYPGIVGMLVGHMHLEITDKKSDSFVQLGGRDHFPVIMGVSAMLSISGLVQDQSARLPSISKYVTFHEDRWEVRYRLHGPHSWGGPGGFRMTTLNIPTGLVSRSM